MSTPESPHTTDAHTLPPRAAIVRMATGFFLSRALAVAAELELADLVGRAPQTAQQLAEATGAHADSVYRLLRFLASHGVFTEDDTSRFHLTPLATVMRSDVPDSVHTYLCMHADTLYWDSVGNLLHTVKTGESAFNHRYGVGFFEYLTQHPESNARFNAGMAALSGPEDADIAQAFNFGQFHRVVDIGGGHGGFLAAVLTAYPNVRGVLYDQPQVVADPTALTAAGVLERCEITGGDFFDTVPVGGDAYILKRVLHDWSDAQAIKVLQQCRNAMAPNGRVLTIDGLMLPGNQADPHKQMDLSMMVLAGGRERTEAEFAALHQQAGLQLARVMATPSRLSIIEGVRV